MTCERQYDRTLQASKQNVLVELPDELVLQALLEVQHQEVHDRLGHQVHEVFLVGTAAVEGTQMQVLVIIKLTR